MNLENLGNLIDEFSMDEALPVHEDLIRWESTVHGKLVVQADSGRKEEAFGEMPAYWMEVDHFHYIWQGPRSMRSYFG